MTLRDLLIFLFKWKGSISAIFLACVTAAVLVTFLASPGYMATAKVLVERNRPPVMRAVMSPGMDLAEALNTEAEILLSRTVVEATVDKLKPHERPKKETTVSRAMKQVTGWLEESGLVYAQPPRERWIQSLLKQVKVKPSIDSSILKVSYGDEDPEWAARLVNELLNQYVEHHIRVFSVKGSSDFYAKKLESVEQELRAKRGQLASLRKKGALLAADETKRDLVQQIGALDAQITTARSDLDQILVRFEPGHREVKTAESKLKRLVATMAEMRQRLARIEGEQAGVDELQLEIGALESAYRDYAKRFDEARLSDQVSSTVINVGAVDYAAVPVKPDNSRMFLIAIATGVGLVLALLVAFIREYFDRRIASPAAAEDILGVPDLGSVGVLPDGLRPGSPAGPARGGA
ncbi:MAG: hypothetical protein JSR69_09745 [Proteobacteria bacterium]|nr:hypothetical protein [Pseudomonadota bacterium]